MSPHGRGAGFEAILHHSEAPFEGVYPVVQNAEGSSLMQVGQSTGGPDIPANPEPNSPTSIPSQVTHHPDAP
jgi:hypothetical protein